MGGGGGLGAGGRGVSKGAEARLVLELFVNKDLYILVGQQGTSSSKKYMLSRPSSPPLSGPKAFPKPSGMDRLKQMRKEMDNGAIGRSNEGIIVHDINLSLAEDPRLSRFSSTRRIYADSYGFLSKNSSKFNNPQKSRLKDTLNKIKTITVLGGGGGGGGASYVFYMTKDKKRMPLVVGAGGGGLAHGPSVDDGSQHGNEADKSGRNQTGDAFGESPAGAGGGWLSGNYTYRDTTGLALVQGGVGGSGCVEAFLGHGGFGGGGGGCTAGGGGGGYAGGRAWSDKGRNGEGGFSFIGANGTLGHVLKGVNLGDGKVMIIPAVVGCGCEYRCVALDPHRSRTMCICPHGWVLHENGTSCIMISSPETPVRSVLNSPQNIILGVIVIITAVIIGAGSFSLYKSKKSKPVKTDLFKLEVSR